MFSPVFLAAVTCFLYGTSAQDIMEGLLRQGEACFKVKDIPTSKTLAESYEPQNPKLGNNDPNTLIFLFTPTSQNEAEALHNCGGALPPNSTYDPGANTEIFIHGWLDGVCRTSWMREMKDQLFVRGKYNVILVDWTWGNTPDLYMASQNSRIVGEQVGFVIKNIMRQARVCPKKFHVIGHSYGAIAAGYCGRMVNCKLRRITALDPAATFYITEPPEKRITYRDAKLVDVIHTEAGNPCLGGTDLRQLGHADFYPNGGSVQKSCYPYAVISLLKGDILYGLISLVPQVCSHVQAIQYYKVSINPNECNFMGVESLSYRDFLSRSRRPRNRSRTVMGMDYEMHRPQDRKRRKYYLKTDFLCPYCNNSYLEDESSLPSVKPCRY